MKSKNRSLINLFIARFSKSTVSACIRMSSSKVDDVVTVYKNLAQIPNLVGAKLSNNNSSVASVWNQRNLERGKNTKFLKTITIASDFKKIDEFIPIDISTELLAAVSASEKYRAVLRDLNEKQYLEIWQNNNLTRIIDLNAADLHGNVYTDGEFGTFRWSPDEKRVLYIAELKVPKSEPFYKRIGKVEKEKSESEEEKKTKGEEYLYRQDWGEQLVGKKKSIIAQYDVASDKIEILSGVPDNVCPAQVVYSPDGASIIGVGYYTEPRKLGLIYCSNRPSTIFSLDFNGNFVPLALVNKSVKSPTVTPDGKTLIWMQRPAGGPHASALSLVKTDLPLKKTSLPSVVVDIVESESQTSNGTAFYGLYNTGFSRRCFASGSRVVLSTNQKNTINSYVIDIESGRITELEYNNGSQIVLDVLNDVVLVNRRNFLMQDKLAIGKLPPKDSESSVNWIELTTSEIVSGLEKCTYDYLEVQQNTDEAVKNSTAIFLGPKSGADKSTTLIVFPHGGPHSAFANNLALETSMFLSMGYAALLVNYRGSIGTGQNSVDCLLGNVGNMDVADCVLATDIALKKYPFLNPDSLVLVGGSHGGFLVTYLSGKYPDKFKCVVARNPVIDVATMNTISDIPDWSAVEAGYTFTQVGQVDDEAFAKMRKASPIEHAHKVKAPTLLQIGSKDLRVPAVQGLDYYHRLRANGATVRMNLYEDNHPLGLIPHEMDNVINSVLWIEKYRL